MEMVQIYDEWNWGTTYTLINQGCGVCTIEFKDNTNWGWICDLKVHPSRRRQGIAREMMLYAEEITKGEGQKITALQVEKEREWQFEWYKRLGYEIYDEDNEFYFMRKYL